MMSILAVVFLVFGAAYAQDPTLRFLGTRDVRLAGFSNLYIHNDSTDPTAKYSFLLSTFNPIPFTRDTTYFIHHIGKYLDDFANAPLTFVHNRFLWPREPSQTPVDVFGFESITQPDGFLVPGKNRGSVNVVDFRDYNNPENHDIVFDPMGDQKDWFYHRVLWKDCNGDGRKDALTLRARVHAISGDAETEMVWFEHPESDVFGGPWEKHVLNKNVVGTFLAEGKLTSGGVEYDILVGTGYFTQMITIFWSNNGLWNDPDEIGSRVIDVGGQFFDVVFDDLNNDGNMDLLVPINAVQNGTLVAYEIPEDFRFGEYKRHLLADDFNSRSGLNGGGSPGQAKTFYPVTSMKDVNKPWIIISGDDEGTTYYLTPNSQDVNDWSYKKINIIDTGEGNILGTPTTADVDGDGYSEVFIPAYNRGEINAFTFAP